MTGDATFTSPSTVPTGNNSPSATKGGGIATITPGPTATGSGTAATAQSTSTKNGSGRVEMTLYKLAVVGLLGMGTVAGICGRM